MNPVSVFAAEFNGALGALVQNLVLGRINNPDLGPGTEAEIVVFTLINATDAPFINTLDPYVDATIPGVGTIRVPFLMRTATGETVPVPADARLTLYASSLLGCGIGIPLELGGTGIGLPDDLMVQGTSIIPGVVLRPDELDTIHQRGVAYNDVIRERVAAYNGLIHEYYRPYEILIYDIGGRIGDVVSGLEEPEYGGISINADFLTGGMISYDGIHLQNVGHAFIAEGLIDLLNDHFDAGIPQVDMMRAITEGGADQIAPPQADLKNVVFSTQAQQQLLEIFPLLAMPNVDHNGEVTATQ
jgi:hypothetical protein